MSTGAARMLRLLLGLLLLTLVLVAAAVAAFLVWGLPHLLGAVTINGQPIALPASLHVGHWAAATLVLAIAALVLLLLLPITLAVTLLLVLLVLVAALSPLWLLLALAVWLWRRSARRAMQADATMSNPSRTP